MQGLKPYRYLRMMPIFLKDYKAHRAIIKEYLAENDGWDVFSGLVVDIPAHANVLDVCDYKGLRFVYLDYFASTVYCIYATGSFLEKTGRLSVGNDTRELVQKNDHIDRYLRQWGNTMR